MRAACLAGIVAVLVLPLALVLLAQPPLVPASGGPVLAEAAQDLSTAALDRVERLLGGHLHVRLAAPCAAHALHGLPRACSPADGLWAARPAASAPLAARPGASERAF